MKTKVIPAVGLDAGSKYTRCVVGAVENGRLRFLGGGATESRGWTNGTVADQGDVSESMLLALREAERNAQLPISHVVLGMGGYTVRGGNTRGHVDLGRPREIEQRDVNRVMKRALSAQLPDDRMVLQMCQQDFIVDDHPGHRDPRHMLANELEVNVHLIMASIQEHNCIVDAAHQAHVKVEETVYEALAACHAAVKEPERREGVAVIDIGAHSTDLVVYYGDALQLAWSLRIGGDHFTRDVVHGLHIGFEDAEIVKEEYGSALSDPTPENSMVEAPAHEDRPPREVPRKMLNKILESRAVDLFGLVYRELERVGMQGALVGGVVLTGGGAELADICEVADHVLGCQACKGLPRGIRDWPQGLYGPEWATVAGLAMYSARLKYHGELERQSAGLLGRMLR
jgi:cell division protein FtsA